MAFGVTFRGLVIAECLRLLRRPRFWVCILAMLLFSIYDLIFSKLVLPGSLRVGGSVALRSRFSLILPLIIGIVATSSFAEDLTNKHIILILARGISRVRYIASKSLAMSAVSMLCVILGYACFMAIAALILPWGATQIIPDKNGSLTYAVGPIPLLFLREPLWNDLLGIAMQLVASTAFANAGLLLGFFIQRSQFVSVFPFIFVVVCIFTLDGPGRIINPYTYLDVWQQYRTTIHGHGQYYSAFLYWLLLDVVFIACSARLFTHKEI